MLTTASLYPKADTCLASSCVASASEDAAKLAMVEAIPLTDNELALIIRKGLGGMLCLIVGVSSLIQAQGQSPVHGDPDHRPKSSRLFKVAPFG